MVVSGRDKGEYDWWGFAKLYLAMIGHATMVAKQEKKEAFGMLFIFSQSAKFWKLQPQSAETY